MVNQSQGATSLVPESVSIATQRAHPGHTFRYGSFSTAPRPAGFSAHSSMSQAIIPFSAASGCLVLMSAPSVHQHEIPLIVYWVSFLILFFGGTGYGNLVSLLDKSNLTRGEGIFYLIMMGIEIFIVFPLGFKLRRRIGNFSINSLKNHLSKTVFLQGIASLPPMAYLTIGSLKCLFKEDHEDYDPSNGKCHGVILPQQSICLMLFLFLIVRLFFLPLTTTKISLWEATSFTNISFKLKLQMVLLGVLLFVNVVMFGLMEEGPASSLVIRLFGVNLICGGILALSEIISIIFLQRSRGRRDSQVDRGETDSIVEHFQGTAGSMEIV